MALHTCRSNFAGVILQPAFRLHKASYQAALRVTALMNYREARGGPTWIIHGKKKLQNFLFFHRDPIEKTICILADFFRKTRGIMQIWWIHSFKLNLCLDFGMCLTSHMTRSMNIGNLKICLFKQFLKRKQVSPQAKMLANGQWAKFLAF